MRMPCLVVLGLAIATGSAAASAQVEVGHDDPASKLAFLRYYPATVVIHTGETVTWKAASFTPHTVTSTESTVSFDSSPGVNLADFAPQFGPGGFVLPSASFNHTFATTGTYHYFCKIHPGMEGTITVVDQLAGAKATEDVAAGQGRDDTSIDRFVPENLTVQKGTRVVWTNGHNHEPHTVTNPAPSDPFDSSPMVTEPPASFTSAQGVLMMGGANAQFTFTFTQAGTYGYVCKLHPAMLGSVVVLAGGGSSPTVAAPLALGILGLATAGLRLHRTRRG